MSTSDSSIPCPPAVESNFRPLSAMFVNTIVSVFQGIAFWASIPLPFVIAGTLATDIVAAHPLLIGALIVLNFTCAVLGHTYSPTA